MTTFISKITMAAMAVAALATTPAMANSYRTSNMQAAPMASEPYAAGDAGYGAYAAAEPEGVVAAPGVISYDRYAGWDPDPTIRLMLKRDAIGKDSP